MTAKARGVRATTPRRPAASKPAPKQDPDKVFVAFNELTAGEIETVEEVTGLPVTRTTDLEKPQGAVNRAVGWVVRLRTDPSVPYDNEACGRGHLPQCADCLCSRRLKVFYLREAAPIPPTGESGS